MMIQALGQNARSAAFARARRYNDAGKVFFGKRISKLWRLNAALKTTVCKGGRVGWRYNLRLFRDTASGLHCAFNRFFRQAAFSHNLTANVRHIMRRELVLKILPPDAIGFIDIGSGKEDV